jgi:hypothetical protein
VTLRAGFVPYWSIVTRQAIAVRAAIAVIAVTITTVFFIDLCAVIYQCGCRSLWAGAADMCNIHIPGARHCPFCAHGAGWYRTVLGLVLIPQLVVCWWPTRWEWPSRLILTMLVFPVATVLLAVALGIADGYWR